MPNPFQSVLEDLNWLRDEWWLEQPDKLTEGHLRRGSTTLSLLLVDDLLGQAWRHYGFARQPMLIGPDIVAIAKAKDLRLNLAAGCIAGGGRQNGIDLSFIGAFRVDNPSTGVLAGAEEGFSVCVTSIARIASPAPPPYDLESMVEKHWSLSSYLESAGAVRNGQIITRRQIIKYFRNHKGAAHHNLLAGRKNADKDTYELVDELEGHVRADVREGLYFELLSIGQSVARSPDVRMLTEKIARS